MSTRSRRGRGRPPKTPLSGRSTFLKKPKSHGTGSEASSRSSTPVSSVASTPTTRGSRSRLEQRASAREAAQKSRNFIQKMLHTKKGVPTPAASGNNSGEDDAEVEGVDDYQDGLSSEEDDFAEELSEASVSSESDISEESTFSEVSSTPSRRKYVPRRPKSPMFPEDKEIPPLILPSSATDLLIPIESIMEAVGIYEVLRHFRTILRISPIRFEDFAAALVCDEQCALMAEIHIQLLRSLLREEDGNTTTFGPHDLKDSININFFYLDGMTWPELIRAYLDSDQSIEYSQAMPAASSPDFPFGSMKDKLSVLKTLTDLFLSSNVVREEIMNEGNIQYDDHCRCCHR